MQFSVIIAGLFAALISAAAVPQAEPHRRPLLTVRGEECSSTPQCCSSFSSPKDKNTMYALGKMNIDPGNDGDVGTDCKPLQGDLVGVSALDGCKGQAACCNDNSFNGLVALGCVMIPINL